MATTFMNLSLPTPTVTLGPAWASQLNDALEVVDSHDHTNGKGDKVKSAGILINSSLEFNNNRATEMEATQFQDTNTTLTGASNALSVYVTNGDLYYTNDSGTAIQVTDGGALASSPGNIINYELSFISSDIIVSPSDTFVYLAVDTSAARSITLPLANAVAAGRIYIIKDTSGNAKNNNITITPAGSDTIEGVNSSYALTSNHGSWVFVGDGSGAWHIS